MCFTILQLISETLETYNALILYNTHKSTEIKLHILYLSLLIYINRSEQLTYMLYFTAIYCIICNYLYYTYNMCVVTLWTYKWSRCLVLDLTELCEFVSPFGLLVTSPRCLRTDLPFPSYFPFPIWLPLSQANDWDSIQIQLAVYQHEDRGRLCRNVCIMK